MKTKDGKIHVLRVWRKSKKMTQHLLAEKVGVSVTTIRHWEGGLHTPNAQHIHKLYKISKGAIKFESFIDETS